MSAKFIWVRNPTAINGLATTYVSLRGSDTNGDGTAQNPYRSLAKATTVAAANTNIMMDDGDWKNEAGVNNKLFRWYGNANTSWSRQYVIKLDNLFYLKLYGREVSAYDPAMNYNNCILNNYNSNGNYYNCLITNTLRLNTQQWADDVNSRFINCVVVNCTILYKFGATGVYKNNIFLNCTLPGDQRGNNCNYNNFCGSNIVSSDGIANKKSINNAITGQNATDYFNYYDSTNYTACDFTAKPGSANIGAGESGSTIGLNEGYPARATNDSNDIFAAANGATLRNVAWNATLNGYSLVHKDKVCAGYTVNTITLAADAEAIDDYYNGLFIGITAGDGAGEIHRIIDYDGATRVATIDTSWQSAISTSSVYSISGTIDSATKDFGRVIKVKRNWAFLANMQSWTDPNVSSYGMWKEFLTSPLQNNGEWMMRPCSNFRYEYSIDNIEWHSSTELLAGTDTDNKTYNAAYGNASESYVAANAKTTVLRYVRYHIEIGFNIGEDAQ